MEISQELYRKAFKNTKTFYEVSDEEPDDWSSFMLLDENATKEDADSYVEAYTAILGQGDAAAGIEELEQKIAEVKKGIKNGTWVDEETYNKKFDE